MSELPARKNKGTNAKLGNKRKERNEKPRNERKQRNGKPRNEEIGKSWKLGRRENEQRDGRKERNVKGWQNWREKINRLERERQRRTAKLENESKQKQRESGQKQEQTTIGDLKKNWLRGKL